MFAIVRMAKKLKLHIRKLEVINNRGAMLRHRKKIRKEESYLTGNADSRRQKNYTQSNSCGFTLIMETIVYNSIKLQLQISLLQGNL